MNSFRTRYGIVLYKGIFFFLHPGGSLCHQPCVHTILRENDGQVQTDDETCSCLPGLPQSGPMT